MPINSYDLTLTRYEAGQIRKSLRSIKSHYDKSFRALSNLSAFGPLSLFYYLFSKHFQDKKAFETAVFLRDHAASKMFIGDKTLFSPHSIFSNHIALNIWEKNIGIPSELYRAFLPEARKYTNISMLRIFRDKRNFEFIIGAAGLGLIAANQQNKALMDRCIEFLRSNRIDTDYGSSYLTRVTSPPGMRFSGNRKLQRTSPGLSHGLAGVLAFGALYFPDELARELCLPLLETLENMEIKNQGAPLPAWWPSPPELNAYPAPTAWCHGDPGIGYAMILAAKRLPSVDRKHYARLGRKIFRRGIERGVQGINRGPQGIATTHFCHGYSGIAQMALRYYQMTGEEWAQESARDLCKKLTHSDALDHIFLSMPGYNPQELLEGRLGLGMVLFSFLSQDDLGWDRYFLLTGEALQNRSSPPPKSSSIRLNDCGFENTGGPKETAS